MKNSVRARRARNACRVTLSQSYVLIARCDSQRVYDNNNYSTNFQTINKVSITSHNLLQKMLAGLSVSLYAIYEKNKTNTVEATTRT